MMYHVIAFHPSARDMGVFFGLIPPFLATLKRDTPKMRLTVLQVQKAKPKEKPYKLSDGQGLYLLVEPSGRKYWRMKYYFARRERLMSLGVFPDVSLSDGQLAKRYSVSKVTIWRWRKHDPNFPQPKKFSPGCTRWLLAEVEAWEASRT